MPARINEPANAELGLVAATTGAARGHSKEEWDSDSGASIHMFHTMDEITAYKEAPAGMTVEVADGIILPVDGFGTVEVDLNPDTTSKPVKMVSVVYARTFAEPAIHP